MHQLGLAGMPRRVYTYLPEAGWGRLNVIATIGAALLATGVLLVLVNVLRSVRTGAVAGDNPWDADTLEWSTTSPPPAYNYLYLPTVNGRYPLWTRQPDDPVVTGMRSDVPEVLVTNVLDAEPDHRHSLDRHALSPFLAAVSCAITFIGVVFTPWALPLGAVLVFLALAAWFFPTGDPVPDTSRESA
jgi:cytochrome c oxidase subunit 1